MNILNKAISPTFTQANPLPMKNRILLSALLLICCNFLYSQTAFQKTLDLNQDDELLCGMPTADGGYIAGGYSSGTPYGGLAVKLNSAGSVQWSKTVGGVKIAQVVQNSWGGYYMAGSNTVSTNTNFYLTKLDGSGNVLWSKTFGKTAEPDELRSLALCPDGGLLMSGYADTLNGVGFKPIAYVIKTDSNGIVQWSRYIGGTNGEEFFAAKPVSSGGYLCCGYTGSYGSQVGTEAYAVRLDNSGNILWTSVFGHNNRFDRIYDFVEDPGIGFYVTGQGLYSSTTDNLFMAKLDLSGNVIWHSFYEEFNGAWSIVKTQDNNLVVGGYYINQTLGLYNDSYLIKADTSGNLIWSLQLGESGIDDKLWQVRETPDAGFFITGSTSGTGSGRASWYMKTNAAGQSGCRDSVVTVPAHILAIASTNGGNAAPVYFGTSATASQINATMSPVVLCSGPTSSEMLLTANEISIYPNPANDFCIVEMKSTENYSLRIFNSTGELIREEQMLNGKTEISLNAFPQGIYLVEIETEAGRSLCKLVKE